MDKIGDVVARSGIGSSLPDARRRSEVAPVTSAKDLPSPFLRLTDRDIPDRVVSFRDLAGLPTELRRELVPTERTAMENRAAELWSALAPAPATSRDKLLDAVLGILPQGLDDETSLGVASSYLETVGARPMWAIVEACLKIRSGGVRMDSGRTLEQTLNVTIGGLVATFEKRLNEIEALLAAKTDTVPARAPSGHLAPTAPPRRPSVHAPPPLPPLGAARHARLMADLEERKARNEARRQEEGHP